ncbi:MAG: CPBP family glutamic-type intramembrane protease [Deltaproteobacteria bacterium]
MCAAIEAGRIDFDAVASTDASPGFLPVANLPRFRRAFEERLRAGALNLDDRPLVGAFEGPFVEDEPTPSSSAHLVVPVPDATGAAPPGLVMVPGLLDESDEHDQDATSDNASTGHITDRDTLIGGDASEGHDTFIQGAAPSEATADLDAERAEADAIADRADAAAFAVDGFGVGGFGAGEALEGVAANPDTGRGDPALEAAFGAQDDAASRAGAAFGAAGSEVPPLDSDPNLRTAFGAPSHNTPSPRARPGHDVPALDSDSGLRTAFAPAGHDVPAVDSDAGLRTAFTPAGHDVPAVDSDSGLRTAFTPADRGVSHRGDASPRTPLAGHDVPALDSDSGLRTAFAPAGHDVPPPDHNADVLAPAGHDVPSLDSDAALRSAFAPSGHDVPALDSDPGLRTAFAPAGHDVPALDSDTGLRTAFAPAGHDVPPLDSDSGLRTAFGVLLDPDTLGPTTDPASPSGRIDDPEATDDAALLAHHGGDAAPSRPPPNGGRLEDTDHDVAAEPARGRAPAASDLLRVPPTGDAATARLSRARDLEDTEDDAAGRTLPRARVTPTPDRIDGPDPSDGEPPTLRPGDATAVGVRTVVGTPEDRDLDTLVGGGLPDGLDMPTDSGVRVTGADIDEVHPTDTQVAVVHPDEDFQPEDLALTSQDDPMPPEHTPPPADAAPIAHGAIAMPTPAARSMTPLWIVLGAWVLLTGTMFFASVARDGGAAEAAWRPASAVLWLRIALTGGVGGLLALALKRALPVTKQLLRLSWEWAGIAILAGACVGAMAPFSRPEAPLAIALILAATLAIAEEAFFRGVLGRVLAVSPLKNRTAIAIAAILYGLYYGTYFVIWQHDDPLQTALALTMITVGAALPYAILQDLTKGVLAPLLCHVSVNVAGVLVRTYF